MAGIARSIGAAPKLRVVAADPATELEAVDGRSPSPDARTRRRIAEISAELDALEMLPFSQPDAAFAPAVTLERQARRLGVEDLEKRAQLIQADVLGRKGKHTASGQLVREIHDWAVAHEHAHLTARSHRLLAMFFDSIGDIPSSWEHAVRAVELTDESMSDRLRADHLFGLGMVLLRTGAHDAARERFRTALQLAESLDDSPLRLKILNNLAWLEDDAGDVHQAMEIAKRMQSFAAKQGIPLDAACLDTMAHAQVLLGHYAEAELTLRPILEEENLDSWPSEGLAEALNTAASAQRLQGQLDRAQATLERSLQLCDARGIAAIRVEALEEQARLYADEGRYQQAYEQYMEFHQADAALRAAEREANARTLQAVFETAEARREGDRFRELALRDALTGLRNRRYAETELPLLIERATSGNQPLVVGLVDLDHFKLVNDRFSHAVGDAVLERVARILSAATAELGWVARLGGEEFLLVFPETTMEVAIGRCEDLRRAVESFRWDTVTTGVALTVSIGVSALHPGRNTQATLLGQADRNLYAAKQAGRNRVSSGIA